MQRDLKAHKSLSYTVLKRIMVNNLYGVDIMEEAVEICKLRLFLKLTAQISELGELEPLPDIDFNIRAGNTLVGYARLADAGQTQAGRTKAMDLFATEEPLKKQLTLVKEQAATYRTNQANLGASYADKQALADQMTATAEVLNLRLADAYGVDVRDERAYAQWKTSHKPFHWCSEFYDIVEERGGFDVIVGNPPYVATSKVTYKLLNFCSLGGRNLYSLVIENALKLAKPKSFLSMIVPISMVSSKSFTNLADLLFNNDTWVSSYSNRPGKLFGDVEQRLTIFVSKCVEGSVKSTEYQHWYEIERDTLLTKIGYQRTLLYPDAGLPAKTGLAVSQSSLSKIINPINPQQLVSGSGEYGCWYHDSPTYWIRALPFEPTGNASENSNHYRLLSVKSNEWAQFTAAILSSSIYYFHYKNVSNCRDFTARELNTFRLPKKVFDEQVSGLLFDLGRLLGENLKTTARRATRKYPSGIIEYDEYYPSKSKHIIDEIDQVLAAHYGFTDEELDYIINYDIKYRMGLVGGAGDDVEE
jgi:hypothetical protein